jgi:hypothetical protein
LRECLEKNQRFDNKFFQFPLKIARFCATSGIFCPVSSFLTCYTLTGFVLMLVELILGALSQIEAQKFAGLAAEFRWG